VDAINVLTLGIGFSSVRGPHLSFVAGPPGGSALIGGNSDRVGDQSSSQKASGSCASGVACGARTSDDRDRSKFQTGAQASAAIYTDG
jgi:hypothetical protein